MKAHRRRRKVGIVKHARARVNPKRHRARRRRRANPAPLTTVMLANPRKVHRRRRKAVSVSVRRRANPHRRVRRIKLTGRHVVRRRSNPNRQHHLGGVLGLVRLGAFGGVGIIVARIAGSLYTQYVAPTVVGDQTDTTQSYRQYLSDFLRLVAMGAASWGVSRALSRMVRPIDAQALMIGGLAETARQAVGAVYKYSGGTSAATYGLDGRPAAFQDPQGNVYQFNPARGGYELAGAVPMTAFDGAVPRSAFHGR